MRLDKFISERSHYTRSQIKDLAAKGKITVNGVVTRKSNTDISQADEVQVSGTVLESEKTLTLLLNKPAGVVSATEDKTEKTVIDILPAEYKNRRLSPVGRLDKDTTGMLLLTNDGELLHNLTSPSKNIPKYYVAHLSRPFTEEAKTQLQAGITLRDGAVCAPAQVETIDKEGMDVLICIHEGKYHQVKRMFAAVGNHVEKLSRKAIGGMEIPADLPLGETIVLLNKDLLKLLNSETEFSLLLQGLRESSLY